MAASSTFFLFFFFAIFFASPFTPASAKPTTSAAKLKAENLIQSLNLSPKHPINIVSFINESSISSSSNNIAEWKLKFPQVNGADELSLQEFGQHAGYYKLPHKNASIFYTFFDKRKSRFSSTVPIVIWLSGGPGCSSELALFYENGPYKINEDLSLKWNNYGWDQASNILFVDQPVGTGFSYTSDENEIPHDEQGVSDDLYDFIQGFLNMHQQYVDNDFYITGESYAGHYVPAFAARVSRGNKENEGLHIKLKGIAIGNGLTDPAIQYAAYSDYALDMKLITKSDHDAINTQMLPQCENSIKACDKNKGESCLVAFDDCETIFSQIMAIAGNINHYDIRKQCESSLCYDFSTMEKFLNLKSVREALHVGNIEFVSCSSTVYDSMLGDFMRGYDEVIPFLLEDGVKVLLYAGEYDLICNWLGNSRWVNAMKWSGQKQFVAAKSVSFVVDGTSAGELRSYGGLTFLKVYNAGHLVPMDQPKASLQMLSNWMNGTLT